MSAEDDLFNPAKDFQAAQIEIGTVGWEGRDDHVEFGTGDNDGHTLVCVTLYRGRTQGEPVKKGVGQGYPVRCHISSLAGARVPPKGTRVLVATPFGMEQLPGAGVIVATIEKTATKDQLQKDRVVIDYGEDVHLVIKAKSVSISDHENRFIGVGTPRSGGDPGLTFQAKDGSGGVIQEGKLGFWTVDAGEAKQLLQMTTTSTEMFCKGGGMWKVDASGFYCFGVSCTMAGSAVYLGKAPTVLNPVLWGTSGPVGAPSPSVFVSPV